MHDPEKRKRMSAGVLRGLLVAAQLPTLDREGISEYSHRGQRRYGKPFAGGSFGDFIRGE